MAMQEEFSCVIVDWNYTYDLCRDINEKVNAAGFKPEVIVGVARGGWYLARVLCDFFLLRDLLSLKMEHWGVTATITGKAELKYGFDDAAIAKLQSNIHEDVMDLLEKVLSKTKQMGTAELITAMKDEFDLYMPYHRLKEVLANMVYHGKIISKEEAGKVVWMLS